MRGTWNPTRRNKNIGTSKSGHGVNNKLVIPDSYRDSRIYWEKFDNCNFVRKEINGREIKFIIESTYEGYSHCCSIEDILYLISHLSDDDLKDIGLFVFRQPKRKEKILEPVWGRLGFNLKVSTYIGPAIILEAVKTESSLYWDKSLTPDEMIEIERLKEDGHKVTFNKRGYTVEIDSESTRATQLYRTLLHEIGHWKQWKSIVINPSSEGIELDILRNKYFNITIDEREKFANRYADETRNKLLSNNIIPFSKI